MAASLDWNLRHTPSAAVVGNVVFVSGCTDDGSGEGVEGQVERVLDQTRHALEAAGSRMENVVKTLFLLTDLADYGRVRKTETEYYESHAPQLVTAPPAATLMVVPALAQPGRQVQLEVVAALDRALPGWPVTYYPERWAGKELAYPHVPKEHAKFARSQAIGNLLVVSGCQALDHDTVRVETSDFAEQSRIVLDKVRVAVEEPGGSLADLVKTTVFVKDARAVAVYRDVEREFFREHAPDVALEPPASTVFVMSELPRPEFLIEVEAFSLAGGPTAAWPMSRRPGSDAAAESVTAGRLVFLSACGAGDGFESEPIEREVEVALDNLREALARAGSALDKLVKVTLLMTAAGDHPRVRQGLLDYYREHAPQLVGAPPASTFTTVGAIVPAPGRLQIDAVAVS